MKVGILGGTFDPIHRGHIAIAKAAKEQLGLDMVRIMPAPNPPHKQGREIADDVHRLMMIMLSLPIEEGFIIDLMEFERQGVSYTSDTLSIIHEKHPDDELYYIIGEDSLRDFPTWHEPEKIARLARIPVAVRERDGEHFTKLLRERNEQYGGAFVALSVPYDPISSTEIRESIAGRRKPHPALSERAEAYIRRFGLYGCKASAITKEARSRYEEYLSKLIPTVHPFRVMHSKGVAFWAAELVCEWLTAEGADTATIRRETRKALLAGILHDCAKYMPEPEMLPYLAAHRVKLSEENKNAPGILHGPAGRVFAREHYGVRDPEILRAIGNHCNGSEQMAEHITELAVFIADFTEPFRDHIPTPPLPVIRDAAFKDRIRGAILVEEATLHYLDSIGVASLSDARLALRALKKYERKADA